MSKGLEALHHPRIKSEKVDISAEGKHDIAYMFFDDTKQYTAIEKELKAFDIIKNKGVNVGNFKDMLEDWKDITFENYIRYRVENGYELQNDYDFETKPLTEEEFDLLKEVLP